MKTIGYRRFTGISTHRRSRTLEAGHDKERRDALSKQAGAMGVFVNIRESLEEAAYRGIEEETGLDRYLSEQLYTWGIRT